MGHAGTRGRGFMNQMSNRDKIDTSINISTINDFSVKLNIGNIRDADSPLNRSFMNSNTKKYTSNNVNNFNLSFKEARNFSPVTKKPLVNPMNRTHHGKYLLYLL